MDPLAQLKDIHLPEQVHNYPIAPGWWLLLMVMIIALFFTIKYFLRYRQARVVKKQALKQLAQCQTTQEFSELLKFVLLHYFDRQVVAQLYGKQLLAFLSQQLAEKHQSKFLELADNCFDALYQNAQEEKLTAQLTASLTFWFTHALPAKRLPSPNTGQQLAGGHQ